MLQVAIARLRQLCPDSQIWVVTTAPEKLEVYCPNTLPIAPNGRQIWAAPLTKYPTRHRWLNKLVHRFSLTDGEQNLRRRFPSLLRSILRFLLRNRGQLLQDFDEFTNAIFNADLVVLTGGGYINDIFPYNVNQALITLELATSLHKPTVMLGHGVGPLENPDVRSRATAVLPLVEMISLREKRAGIPLLQSLEVSPDRIWVTGDDAIELAYQSRQSSLGNGIGINLRASHYSGVDSDWIEPIKQALHQAATALHAPLVAVPISRHCDPGNENPDSATIQQLLQGYPQVLDSGFELDTPQKVIEQTSLCRVVVTASYHAAVFALSQGIPTVTLVNSEYYADKFLGLADQFGLGCSVVFLSDKLLEQTLIEQINQLWHTAATLRSELLNAAVRQVEAGHSAYQQVYKLIN